MLWGRPWSLQLPPCVQDICHPRGSPSGPVFPRQLSARECPLWILGDHVGSAWLLGLGLRGPSARSLGQSPSRPGRVVTACCWLCLQLVRTWRSGLVALGALRPRGDVPGPWAVGQPPARAPSWAVSERAGRAAGAALTACVPVPQLPHCPGLPHLQRAVHHRAVCCPGHRDPLLDGTYQREGPCALAPRQVGCKVKPATPGLSHPRDPVPEPHGGLALGACPNTGGLEAVGTPPSWLPTLPGYDHWPEKAEE